ncbi:MAG: M15 family metallopeptidase [Actinomycetota bacterium]
MSTPPVVRRRRLIFVGTAALLAGSLVWAMLRSGATAPTVGSAAMSAPASSAPPVSGSADPTEMPPVWLAWISGSLPEGFGAQAAATPALGTTVIVSGDTRWMTSSHDAGGKIVDRPTPPFAIPIDAFAVDPTTYAPFVPNADRQEVLDALRAGTAVLGTSSAQMRHLSVGGSLTFDQGTVEVGAIVPDPVAGWSEMLVSRAEARTLGIADERYLLSMPAAGMTENRFASILSSLIPDAAVRTLPPGGSTFMRIASGVNPPILMKAVFGEFAAYPRSDNPAYLTMSPTWYDTHIATRSVPLLGRVTCNVELFPALVGALRDVARAGLGNEIHTYSGCYAARTVARSPTAPPSNHAYGAAIDINAPENPYGATPTMDPRIVAIFKRWGFLWGGDYLTPDGMHFEYGSPAQPGV